MYPSHEALVKAAGDGEVRVFCMGKPSASYFLFKLGLDREFRYSAPVYVSTFHRAVHKGNSLLFGIIQDGFDKITEDERKQIEEKWLGAPILNQEALDLARKVGYFLLVVLVLALALVFWNVALRRRVSAKTVELRTLTENHPDCISRLDVECRHIFVNEAAQRLAGLTAESMLGRTVCDFPIRGNPEAMRPLLESCRQVVATAMPDSLEFTWPNGRVTEERHFPEMDELGAVVSVLVITQDITERKRIEEALRESERHYRTLAEHIPDNVGRYDTECLDTYMNATMATMLGVDNANQRGKTPLDAAPFGGMAVREFENNLRQVLTAGESLTTEIFIDEGPHKGQTHNVHFVAERAQDGNIVGVLAIGRDITEFKKKELQIEESRNTLRELVAYSSNAREEERKRIAREIHDELGQMLTAQRLDIATLKFQFGEVNPVLAERCQRLMELADKTIQVVRNVALALRPAALDMGAASALEGLASEFIARTGINCRLYFSGTDMTFDEERSIAMFRIVQESLTNVTRHAEAKQVEISLEKNDDCYLLSIRDDGKGFDIERIRNNSFGLVGIRERALMMGGEASFASAPGRGTDIQIRIPLNRTESTAS